MNVFYRRITNLYFYLNNCTRSRDREIMKLIERNLSHHGTSNKNCKLDQCSWLLEASNLSLSNYLDNYVCSHETLTLVM